MAATKDTRRRAVVTAVLVMVLALAACLLTDVAASVIPADDAHPPLAVPLAASKRTDSGGGGDSDGSAAVAASVPYTLRKGFVFMSAAECRSTVQYLVKAKRALADADCADKAEQATRLEWLQAAIRIMRAAAKRSPSGIQSEEVAAVAAGVSVADPEYVCAIATSTTQEDSTNTDADNPQTNTDLAADLYNGRLPLPGYDVVLPLPSATCCPDWNAYDGKCCFMSCFHMADLFPGLLTIDYCCQQLHNICEPTHSCPNHVVYAVAP
ncbi:hypothetical protein MMPV_005964 [Pyropia vietnamensis]